MYSAPAIVDSNSRTGSRTEVAYFGDIYGMVHAVDTATGNEKWSYIPRNLLGKLKNDRTDPNADQDFAAVNGSPVAQDIYFDHDGNTDTAKVWRTILVFAEGWGNNYIFALDVTDPDNWSVMWERTVEPILSYTGLGDFNADDTLIAVNSTATGTVVEDDTTKNEISLKNTSGEFEENLVVFRDLNNDGDLDTNEKSVTVTHVVEMGHAFRTALGKLKWPILDQGEITGYEQKWVVFVATNFLLNPTEHGGINVFAFDLATGDKLWHFSDKYFSSHNDMPGAITLFDTTRDGYVDRLYVGDMDGRLWELEAATGANPNGTDDYVNVGGSYTSKPIPLFNAGTGYPIAVSPAVVRINPVIVIFGTGGTNWAEASQAYNIYAVNASSKQTTPTYAGGAGTLYWQKSLATGEKVWSSPTVAGDRVYVATATGTMNSDNPRDDIAGTGRLYAIRLRDRNDDGTAITEWTVENVNNENIGKVHGSLYVDRGHLYMTTVDNKIVQIGNGNFTEGDASNVKLRAWKQLN
jgi:Tfp pilus tip-associated adhesin PilY1